MPDQQSTESRVEVIVTLLDGSTETIRGAKLAEMETGENGDLLVATDTEQSLFARGRWVSAVSRPPKVADE